MKLKKILHLFLIILILLTLSNCSANTANDDYRVQNYAEATSSMNETGNTDSESTYQQNDKNTTTNKTTSESANTTTLKSSNTTTKKNISVSTTENKTKPKNTRKEKTTKSKKKDSKTVKQTTTEKTYTCTFSIECSTILDNMKKMDSSKLNLVPSNGIILSSHTVEFSEGETVYDVLQRICKKNKIQMEASWTGVYNSAYIEGINNIYEFDCGSASGWKYCVNGWYPNYGCSRYQLKQGDIVEWRYTCNYGKDIGVK